MAFRIGVGQWRCVGKEDWQQKRCVDCWEDRQRRGVVNNGDTCIAWTAGKIGSRGIVWADGHFDGM